MTHTRIPPERNGDRDAAGRFTRGNSGRPPGARGRTGVLAGKLLTGSADDIVRKLIAEALAGNPVALRLAVERLLPVKRDQPLDIELPELRAAADAPGFLAAVAAYVASGRLTPSEGEKLSRLADALVRCAELATFDERLRKLEESAHAPK